jgi:hypothetical protein
LFKGYDDALSRRKGEMRKKLVKRQSHKYVMKKYSNNLVIGLDD